MSTAVDEFRQRIKLAVSEAKTKDMDLIPLYDDHAYPPPMWTLVRRKLDLSRFPLPEVRFVTVGITPTASCRSARVNIKAPAGALVSGLELVKGRCTGLSTEPDAAIIQTLYHREPWFEDADSGTPVTDVELVGCLCPGVPPGRFFHIRIGEQFHEYGENAEILRLYHRDLIAFHQQIENQRLIASHEHHDL